MKLKSVLIENFRAIEKIQLPLHPQLTVLVGENGTGKTSFLDAISMVLGEIPSYFKLQKRRFFDDNDLTNHLKSSIESAPYVRVQLENMAGLTWHYESQPSQKNEPQLNSLTELHKYLEQMINDLNESKIVEIPVLAYYGMNRDTLTIPNESQFDREFHRFDALKNALNVTPDFGTLFEWFFGQENLEHREKFERKDLDY
ncbi:hypothetical protein PN36_26030, partial [Candidatus Thiomargarita nelsonii]